MSRMMEKVFLKQQEDFAEETRKQNANVVIPEGVTLTENVPYLNDGDAAHRMDIYESALLTEKRPVIINVHGGGLIEGSKEFNKRYCFQLCRLGFLVFSIEYPLVPEVTVFRQFEAVSRAMDSIGGLLSQYAGDPDRVYVVGDSAGAYLMIYTIAMQRSPALAEAAGVRPSALEVQALGLISGMFYTRRLDKIGLFLPGYLYGKGYRKSSFAPYTDPEHPEVAANLPPCFLITSKNDMLQRYTLEFANALSRYDRPHSLINLPANPALTHAFSVFEPERQESVDVTRDLCKYLLQYRKGASQ